jgi:cytidylate kinase
MRREAPIPVIAIDGPTASGKGTIAQRVADALGWHYLDSGALYRVTALAAMRGLAGRALRLDDPGSEPALAALAARLPVRFQDGRVLLDEDDVSTEIRTEGISQAASLVAAMPSVRAALLERQRSFRQAPGLVADGRDMGTVIFPDAMLKVFLTASARVRAERRHKQLIEKGFSVSLESLLHDLEQRDARDSTRKAAPLVPAPDALTIDSSSLDIDQTVARVLGSWEGRRA